MAKTCPPQVKPARPRSGGTAPPARVVPAGTDDFLIVGIGASAGGLDACRKLVQSFPAMNGMSFILVQHLDPAHESMMVELLANHTAMAVLQAADSMPLERDHLYVIPPGTYLSVGGGALHLSEPQAAHGARLPFDFLLRSLAAEYGERVVAVVLSGTAADGSRGVKAVKEKGGLVIAQDPDEAAYDGMPRNAILTGAVDLVLPVAAISDALVKYARRMALIDEGALSVTEEYQSTNEELLTSKEELQSLSEELTALNSQLQETLERQRTTSNDLQNILYSTNVATLVLDTELKIRFFTPATKALFSVISSDIGRPLADLTSLADDNALLADARAVLQAPNSVEQEVQTPSGAWYIRRILPYRTQDNGIEGVVITFADITERKHIAATLEATERKANLANIAKSRFLASASHDLRQPLQALSLMRGALDKRIKEGRKEEALALLTRFDDIAATRSGMLNALLDINQIEAGTVHAQMVSFPIAELLDRLRDEFTYHAQVEDLALHVVPCHLSIYSDPRLLEQMIRNLLSNALKYTVRGKVLLGCRRRNDVLSIEIWDTGVGIPNEELQTIFDEYHQLDNASRARSRGLGLGLSIVQRLADLLGHRVHVRSQPGKGSAFAIDIELPLMPAAAQVHDHRPEIDEAIAEALQRTGTVLIIEDDPHVCDLLDLLLKDQGCHTVTASDGITALDLVTRGQIRPDLILTDYNLPKNLDGLQVAEKLRALLHSRIPVIVLTGDISTSVLRTIARHDCIQLNKPVRLKELTQALQRLLPASAIR